MIVERGERTSVMEGQNHTAYFNLRVKVNSKCLHGLNFLLKVAIDSEVELLL